MALADAGLVLGVRAAELAGRAVEAGARLGVRGRGFAVAAGFPRGFPTDLPEPQNDPERVREMADEILSRPEYRDPGKSLYERARDWLAEQIAELLENIGFGSSGAGSVVGWIVVLVLGALVAGLAYWLIRSVIGDGWRLRRGDEGDPVILAVDEHRTPDEWLSEAERHEAEGRWREGLLHRYRSLATRLVELEVIPAAIGRTAGEYIGDVVERLPAGAGPFRAATDLFESAWYGGVDTGPEGRDRFVGLAQTVLAVAADRPRRAAAPAGEPATEEAPV
jgi:hypothetical protein